ncbi:MAG: hypothetical protein CFE37_13725 [Alphaproteobacteria bacterium PA4]|nr:MAG: hypothetical protein CFE37_13725 [Alphaproteobacteria bacterium PA4]
MRMTDIGKAWGFLLVLVAAPGLAAPPKQDASAFQKVMLAEVNQLVADYNSGDPDKLGTHYADDQVLMVDGAPNLDAAGARKRREQQTNFAITLAVSNIVIDAPASEDMATVRSACIVTVADKSSGKVLMTQANNCLLGYRRQADGTMKVNWGLTVPTVPHTVAPPPPPSSPAR